MQAQGLSQMAKFLRLTTGLLQSIVWGYTRHNISGCTLPADNS